MIQLKIMHQTREPEKPQPEWLKAITDTNIKMNQKLELSGKDSKPGVIKVLPKQLLIVLEQIEKKKKKITEKK